MVNKSYFKEVSSISTLALLQYKCVYWFAINWKNNRNSTATEPNRFLNSLQYLRTLHIVWILVRRRITRRLTRLQLCTMFLIIANHGEITTQFQFTGTATKPHPNHTFRKFNNDQYCKTNILFQPSKCFQQGTDKGLERKTETNIHLVVAIRSCTIYLCFSMILRYYILMWFPYRIGRRRTAVLIFIVTALGGYAAGVLHYIGEVIFLRIFAPAVYTCTWIHEPIICWVLLYIFIRKLILS